MERVLFLNSSGAIITDFEPYPNRWGPAVITENPLPGGGYTPSPRLAPITSATASRAAATSGATVRSTTRGEA